MGISLSTDAIQQLITYSELMLKWNKAYNLTAIRDPEQIITHHILDSLTLLPFLTNSKAILDVGTGAGLPGIPIAIARPDLSVTCLDSQQKKINFVQHVITSLKLTNALAIHTRVEDLPAEPKVDTIVSRAFSSLNDFVTLIDNLCDSKTKIIAMKGREDKVSEESQSLRADFRITGIEAVAVPGLDAERCLVFLTKKEE
jgi:16S rRNA (guanine527-N7)-methyltransferase